MTHCSTHGSFAQVPGIKLEMENDWVHWALQKKGPVESLALDVLGKDDNYWYHNEKG